MNFLSDIVSKIVTHFTPQKRQRSPSPNENFFIQKRQKLSLPSHLQSASTRHGSVLQRISITPPPIPNRKPTLLSDVQTPYDFYKRVVSDQDEHSQSSLSSKARLLRETAKLAQESLEQLKNSSIAPEPDRFDDAMKMISSLEISAEIPAAVLSTSESPPLDWDKDSPHPEESAPNPILEYQKDKPIHQFTPKELEELDFVLSTTNDNEVLVKMPEQEVLGSDLKDLLNGKELRSECINACIKLLEVPENVYIFDPITCIQLFKAPARLRQSPAKFRRFIHEHKLNSLLTPRLVVFPIFLKDHWMLGIINNSAKIVQFYDPVDDRHSERIFNGLSYMLSNELGEDDYECFVDACPRLENIKDSGVFMLRLLEDVICGEAHVFSEEEMPHYRRYQAWKLLHNPFTIKNNV